MNTCLQLSAHYELPVITLQNDAATCHFSDLLVALSTIDSDKFLNKTTISPPPPLTSFPIQPRILRALFTKTACQAFLDLSTNARLHT